MASPLGCSCALLVGLVLAGLAASITTVLTDDPRNGTVPEEVEGIDPTLLDAYVQGPVILEDPGYSQCTGLRWQILAGIGAVESDHGTAVTIHADGTTDPPFVGPRLDGSGVGGNTTPHYDTDGGKWDGDTEYDAAVGLTQHLPANWADYGVNVRGGGEADPHNVFDSVASTAVELCQSAQGEPVDFDDREDLESALFRYNPAWWYVEDVMTEIDHYDSHHPGTAHQVGPGRPEGVEAAEWALAQVGKPYVWGGTGPDAFDCSGLTMRAWEAAGVPIPRVTTDQYTVGQRVDLDALSPGDLLFYDTSEYAPGLPPTHVTMYVGDGQMVNAPSSGQDVRVEPVDSEFYSPRFMGAIRPPL